MTKPLLHCTGLTARHNGRELFTDAEIRLPDGTLTVLQGESGSGKSTLLRQLVGLEPAPLACRWIDGRELSRKELAGWRASVTLAAQDAPILDDTVEENLAFPYRYRAAGPREYSPSRARELLDRCGLDAIAMDQRATVLSGGERHRLALVRGLLWDPTVLVADEPLAGLDSTTTQRCWQQLEQFAHRSGHAVLCTLHDDALAERGDRRIHLAGGIVSEVAESSR